MTTHTWPTREEWANGQIYFDDAWFKPKLQDVATPEEIEAARAAMWETWKAMGRGEQRRQYRASEIESAARDDPWRRSGATIEAAWHQSDRREIRLGWKMLGEGELPRAKCEGALHPALEEFHRRVQKLYKTRLAEWMTRERARRLTDEGWQQELARRERIDTGPRVIEYLAAT